MASERRNCTYTRVARVAARLSGATTMHRAAGARRDKPPCLRFTPDALRRSGPWKVARRRSKHAWSFQLKPSCSLVDVQLFSGKAHWVLLTGHRLRGGADVREYFYGLLDLIYAECGFMPFGGCFIYCLFTVGFGGVNGFLIGGAVFACFLFGRSACSMFYEYFLGTKAIVSGFSPFIDFFFSGLHGYF